MKYYPMSITFFRALLSRSKSRLGNTKVMKPSYDVGGDELQKSKNRLENIKYVGGELQESILFRLRWFHSYYGAPIEHPRNFTSCYLPQQQHPRNFIARYLPQQRSIHHQTQCQQPRMSRLISTTTRTLKKKVTGDNLEPRTPKRIHTDDDSPVIILIDREEKLSTTTLMQAGKMAKRRDLKLVKIEDPTLNKTKDVYKLLTGKEYYEQEVKAKNNAKISQELKLVEKKIVFTSKIGPSDLTNKLHNIHKWLMKSYQIKVYLNSTGTKEDMDNTFSTIEKEVAQLQGHIQQVKESANSFKFYIVPTKVKEAKTGKPPENSISRN